MERLVLIELFLSQVDFWVGQLFLSQVDSEGPAECAHPVSGSAPRLIQHSPVERSQVDSAFPG